MGCWYAWPPGKLICKCFTTITEGLRHIGKHVIFMIDKTLLRGAHIEFFIDKPLLQGAEIEFFRVDKTPLQGAEIALFAKNVISAPCSAPNRLPLKKPQLRCSS